MNFYKHIILCLVCLTGFKTFAQKQIMGITLEPFSGAGAEEYSFTNIISAFYISQNDDSPIGLHALVNIKTYQEKHYTLNMPNFSIGMTYRFNQYRSSQFLWGTFYAIGNPREEFRIDFHDGLGNVLVFQDKTSKLRHGLGAEFIIIHPIGKRLSFVHHIRAIYTINNIDDTAITKKFQGLENINTGFNRINWALGIAYRL